MITIIFLTVIALHNVIKKSSQFVKKISLIYLIAIVLKQTQIIQPSYTILKHYAKIFSLHHAYYFETHLIQINHLDCHFVD